MSSSVPAAGRPVAPWGLIGTLVVVAAFESWVASRWLDLTGLAPAGYRYSARLSRHARGYDVLCFGDSLVKHGVVPAVVREKHGPTLNLACSDSRPPYSYFLLKRALDSGARPRAVLVDFHSSQLVVDPRLDHFGLTEGLGPRECVEFGWILRDPETVVRLLTFRALPSLRDRRELRARVTAALGGKTLPSSRDRIREWYDDWTRHHGSWLQSYTGVEGPDGRFWDEQVFDRMSGWSCPGSNARFIRKFLTLAARHGVAVYWLVPPVHPRLQEKTDRRGDTAGYDRIVRAALARYPNLTVVDGRRARFPRDVFLDATHLNTRGAELFSRQLADVVRPARPERPAARWIVLSEPAPPALATGAAPRPTATPPAALRR